MIKLFNKKWRMTNKNKLVDISNMHISSWDVVSFLYFLYKEYDYNSIAVEYHCGRCYLHYHGYLPRGIKLYFEDRNPSQIEELCRTLPSFTGTTKYVDYKDGFKQILFIEKEVNTDECKEEES